MTKNRHKHFIGVLLALCLMITSISAVALAADGTESTVEVSTYQELLNAIENAENGGEILITDFITINVESRYQTLGSTAKRVTLKRANENACISITSPNYQNTLQVQNLIFDGAEIQTRLSMIFAETNCIFRDIEVKNCFGTSSAVYIGEGIVSFANCTFDNNTSTQGAHIGSNSGGNVSIDNCIFRNGTATYKGGAIQFGSVGRTNTISDSEITGNSAGTYGGGISNCGNLTIERTKINGNTAIQGGNDIASEEYGSLALDTTEELNQLYKADNKTAEWIVDNSTERYTFLEMKLTDIPEPTPTPDPTPDPTPEPTPTPTPTPEQKPTENNNSTTNNSPSADITIKEPLSADDNRVSITYNGTTFSKEELEQILAGVNSTPNASAPADVSHTVTIDANALKGAEQDRNITVNLNVNLPQTEGSNTAPTAVPTTQSNSRISITEIVIIGMLLCILVCVIQKKRQ